MDYSRRTDGEGQRATTLELFYDLVFVFAITQVSHLLLEHLTWAGVGQSVLVLLVVWWSWNYTTWVTNELDTEAISVRLLMISLMLLSMLMAVAIPQAFEERALLFAGSYVAIQVGRHTFLTFVAWGAGTVERERAGRVLTWFVAAGVLWVAAPWRTGRRAWPCGWPRSRWTTGPRSSSTGRRGSGGSRAPCGTSGRSTSPSASSSS
jgi:low temperature requirement protein LtrA